MEEMNLYEKERITLKIINFISQELKFTSVENIKPDLIINKGQHMLNAESIHRVLACIADDTGISMITLRRCFPYHRYFITWKSGGVVMIGVAVFIIVLIIFFIGEGIGIALFMLVFLIEIIAFVKYIKTCFIRNIKSEFTIELFIEIIVAIINKHHNELTFGITPQERQIWGNKIYEVFGRYLHIFPATDFSPGLIIPISDPDEFDMPIIVEECGEILSFSFEEIDQSGIYEKYIDYDEDELLTVVHFADILIDYWAENKIKVQNKNTLTSELRGNIIDKIGYHKLCV